MRISKRHTDISMPLDLSDEETIGDHDVVNQAIQALDKDGWNTKGRWLRASWIVRSNLWLTSRSLTYISGYATPHSNSEKKSSSSR
jgi:hypothetical protein